MRKLNQNFRASISAHILFLSTLIFSFGFSPVIKAELYVTITSLKEIERQVQLIFPANVEPKNVSQLSAGIGAKIIETTVEIGDSVKADEILARLDCRDAKLRQNSAIQELQQAKIRLEFSKRQAERIRRLADTNIASEEVRDERMTNVAHAEISLSSAQTIADQASLMVSRCVVKAPFDATVQDQLSFVGTRVGIGTPIFQIVSDDVNVHANIPFDVNLEKQVTIIFEYGDRSLPVKVSRISDSVNNQTGTRLLRLTPSYQLDPGVPGVIKISSSKRVLPADYLVERDRQLGLMSIADGRAIFIQRSAAILGQPVDVSDLAPDTKIISKGRFRAQDGDLVVVTQ